MDELGIDRAIIVGHSFGGADAAAFALAYPERTQRAGAAVAGNPSLAGRSDRPGIIRWRRCRSSARCSPRRSPIRPACAACRGYACVFSPNKVPDGYAWRAAIPLVLRPGVFRANAIDVAGLYRLRLGRSLALPGDRSTLTSSSPATATRWSTSRSMRSGLPATSRRRTGAGSAISATSRTGSRRELVRGRDRESRRMAARPAGASRARSRRGLPMTGSGTGRCAPKASGEAPSWRPNRLGWAETARFRSRQPVRADIGDAQHVGGARRAERHAGGDDDAVAGLAEAFREGDAAGAVDHVVEIGRVRA